MKIRDGFVSNSSSSSFIIQTKDLTLLQIEQIKNYYFAGLQLGMNIPHITQEEYNNCECGTRLIKENMTERDKEIADIVFSYMSWVIDTSNPDYILACTYMDNFSMYEFLEKIGVDNSIIQWEEY